MKGKELLWLMPLGFVALALGGAVLTGSPLNVVAGARYLFRIAPNVMNAEILKQKFADLGFTYNSLNFYSDTPDYGSIWVLDATYNGLSKRINSTEPLKILSTDRIG